VKRGLLVLAILVLAILAWPAMTPGLFSGEGVRDAWKMAAETPGKIIYSPLWRRGWYRLHAFAHDVALQVPAQGQKFAETVPTLLPAIQRGVRPIYAEYAPRREPDGGWSYVLPGWSFRPFLNFHAGHRHHHHPGKPPVTTPVPEPATWMMMIGGFGLVGLAIRRRAAAARAA